ncbi:MAG: hypothetical protein O3A53_11580 [Acidobacteria bacterium]|nr:hypothetical protein [Acidobacteriota bacterium]MDA1235431.1 hypothetical protein [Acidobacteriota bacterium]
MGTNSAWRPLAYWERGILDRFFECEFPGREELRPQLDQLSCATVREDGGFALRIDGVEASQDLEYARAHAEYEDEDGIPVYVRLYAKGDQLCLLEIFRVDGGKPAKRASADLLEPRAMPPVGRTGMLQEEFSTLEDLFFEQPIRDESGQLIALAGLGKPTRYRNDSGYFCAYQLILAGRGTVRMLERADSAPRALRQALDNLAVRVYGVTETIAGVDRWHGFAEVPDVAEATERFDANDRDGAVPYLERLVERGDAWARGSLGMALLLKMGSINDSQRGLALCELAAEQGDCGICDLMAGLHRHPPYEDREELEYYCERATVCGIGLFTAEPRPE